MWEEACLFGGSPMWWAVLLLTLGVLCVNGFTDAPLTVVTCVTTGALPLSAALALAAAGDLLGLTGTSLLAPRVAETVVHVASFGGDPRRALAALCAGMTAVVIWALGAWRWGLPTSESHALLAGLTGAALALQGGGVGVIAWQRTLAGLALSLGPAAGLGWLAGRETDRLCRARPGAARWFRPAQIVGAGAMALLHGAQDGQKFVGILLLGVSLARGQTDPGPLRVPLWLALPCAGIMAAGTALGGRRILRRLEQDVASLRPEQGFAADAAGAVCLAVSLLGGLPVSTTHLKTAAMLGVGAAAGRRPSPGTLRDLLLAWGLTFPACGAIGWATAQVFLRL